MCAINGRKGSCTELVTRMNEATIHRGPDGSSVLEVAGMTVGHNRLAIIDLHKRSDQPMTSNDGRYTIVFNGELYNYHELKDELRDRYEFVTNGDTEVLLAAYSVWGKEMLRKLKGIFAFAIIDKLDNSVLLVRDQVGVKPLYYSLKDGLTFSSELKGMAKAGFFELDENSVSIFLAMQYVPSPGTMLKHVCKLEPGQFLQYHEDGSYQIEYYEPIFLCNVESRKNQNDPYQVIDAAIESQLVSDRPVGLFLSGGLDSSIVLHHAVSYLSNIETFSVDFELEEKTFENQQKFNFDALTAKKTAEYYGVNNTTLTITAADIARSLEAAFSELDEPVGNPTTLSKYLLSKKVREAGIVVALGGDGGDEVFKGYPRYRAALASEHFQKLPKDIQKILARVHPTFMKMGTPLGPSYSSRQVYNQHSIFSRITKNLNDPSEPIYKLYDHRYGLTPPNFSLSQKFMAVDAFTWLPDESLQSSDRASMAHALEYRVPLLDIDVIKYAQSFRQSEHISLFGGKKLLIKTYGSKLPPHLFNKHKRGWFSPAAKWIRNELVAKKVLEIASNEYSSKLKDFVDWQEYSRLLADHQVGKVYAVSSIWNIIQLQVWLYKTIR